MTVAYAYFKYITDRENNKALMYYFPGTSDVQLIFDETPTHWDDMDTQKGVDAPVLPTATVTEIKHDVIIETNADGKSGLRSDIVNNIEKKFSSCKKCIKATFVVLGVIAVIAAVALIILAVLTSLATKAYDAEQSSRMVAMVLLAVSAAVTISVVIYGEVAVFKKKSKRVHVAALVLLLLAIVQALIAGISVNVEPVDEAKLIKALAESFKLAKEDNPRHLKIWALTQSDLNCCGVYSPEDYRSSKLPYYFPPNVPISCCLTYDSSRSDLVQERDRELCKVKKTYYTGGCKDPVLRVFKETSHLVFVVTIILIVIEVLLMILGAVICHRKKQNKIHEPTK